MYIGTNTFYNPHQKGGTFNSRQTHDDNGRNFCVDNFSLAHSELICKKNYVTQSKI